MCEQKGEGALEADKARRYHIRTDTVKSLAINIIGLFEATYRAGRAHYLLLPNENDPPSPNLFTFTGISALKAPNMVQEAEASA